jgi:tetratricopeptide (TPR) repeat protein
MAEKTISEVTPDVRGLFEKGNEALERRNVDYALTLFHQALQREPSFFECRKALRAAQFTKAGGGGGGGSFFRKMISGASATPQLVKAQMALRNNPEEALSAAEQALNSDPNNSSAHQVVAEAALALEMPKTAVLSLEIVYKNSPSNKSVVMQLATALAGAGDIGRAERLLAELRRAHPADPELAQFQKNLSAQRTLTEGGYSKIADGKGTFRDALRDKEEAKSLEQEKRVVKTEDVAERLIREYEQRLQTEGENPRLMRSLAELYTQKKRFDEALGYYAKLQATDLGADAALDRAIAETTMRKLDYEIEQLDPNAPDQAEHVARLRTEKQAFQIAECQRRVEKYPTDLGIRFEMGVLYFKAGRVSEAIQEFQKSQSNPVRRIESLLYLGKCFTHRGINDLAIRTFQNAIKEKTLFDDEKKELVYALGCALEKAGKKEEAIEQFKQIYEVDIGYQDVSAKIDAYYAGS